MIADAFDKSRTLSPSLFAVLSHSIEALPLRMCGPEQQQQKHLSRNSHI